MNDPYYLFPYYLLPLHESLELQEKHKKIMQEGVAKIAVELAEFIKTGAYKKRPEPMTHDQFEKKMAETSARLDDLARAFETIATQPPVPTSKLIH